MLHNIGKALVLLAAFSDPLRARFGGAFSLRETYISAASA
jgi:hypothetical protein